MGLKNHLIMPFTDLVNDLLTGLIRTVEELGREREERGRSVAERENGEDLD